MREVDCLNDRIYTQNFKEWLQPNETTEKQISLNLINTRIWINELSRKYNRTITIDTIPDIEWEEKFSQYDSFWFMGVYQPSDISRNHAQKYAHEYIHALPDIDVNKDVSASPFAIPDYSPNPVIVKDWTSWDEMVDKLHVAGKKVYIDFVPNHTAIDHRWVKSNPDYYIQGDEQQYQNNPLFYHRVVAHDGRTYYLAHGKDPNYPEWVDTLQLNYAKAEVQAEMEKQLLSLVVHADGVRCDMAMLLNPSTFLRTWGWCLSEDEKTYIRHHEFWKNVIPRAKERAKALGKEYFDFIAEAYWDKEELGQDFDYIYRDELYKHLRRIADGEPVDNLKKHIEYLLTASRTGQQYHDVVYIENHDEERAVRVLGKGFSQAAAAAIGFIPETIFMVNQGQEDGRTIRPPMQINRPPQENPDMDLKRFYQDLLVLKRSQLFQKGYWEMANMQPSYSSIIALKVNSPDMAAGAIICVNISSNNTNCYLSDIKSGCQTNIYNLNKGININPDQIYDRGMFIELTAFESQIVFFEQKAVTASDRQRNNLDDMVGLIKVAA